ncbi:MAG: hypothetical protein NZO58_12115, partial [Gemmataceae bacterium]|nr:hypothetical protein [Gemmataceae bacterium]
GSVIWAGLGNWFAPSATDPPRRRRRWYWLAVALLSPMVSLIWVHHAESAIVWPTRIAAGYFRQAATAYDPVGPRLILDDGRPLYVVAGVATLLTDRQQRAVEAGFLQRRQLSGRLIRLGPAPPECNCHGWVFTAGRYSLSGNDVETILRGNGYQPVTDPSPGDLVVYRNPAGYIMHTGVVHSILPADGTALVESLWVNLGRYLHALDGFRFDDARATVYRSQRSGHLLRGLEAFSQCRIRETRSRRAPASLAD